MKILLIYPLDRDFMPPSMPPMGLAYISSALERAGHDVMVIDLNGDRVTGESRLKEALSSKSFGMIGISSIITQFKRVKQIGALIRSLSPDTPIVMGGPGPTSIPDLYLERSSGDIICIGEGEETVVELAAILESGGPLERCKGIAYKSDGAGAIRMTETRDAITRLDDILFPGWKNFHDMETYVTNYLFRQGRSRGMSLLSTRGCPGHCNYCMCNFGRKLRMRSSANISAEIRGLRKDYGIEHLHFIDDTFTLSPKRTAEFCEILTKDFPGLTWSANARADFVSPEVLGMMRKAGCVSLAYGIESGSQRVIDYMRKGISIARASDAIRWTREAGISVISYFMIGMPCETKETVQESVKFCKENLVGGEFFFATPFPGTELYRYALDKRLITDQALYLEYAGEVRDFVINLTAMSNEELFRVKEDAEAEIRAHLLSHGVKVRDSIRKDPRVAAASLPSFGGR